MKYQKGFAPLVIILALIIAATAGGAYVAYKQRHEARPAVAVENTQDVSQAQPGAVTQVNGTIPAASASVATAAALSCGSDANCLIAAAAQCQTATGSITRSDVPYPFFPELLVTVKNTFSMKKNGNTCVLAKRSAIQGTTLTAEGKAELASKGLASAEIDAQVKEMTDAMVKTGIITSTCKSDSATVASYFTDLKNNYSGDVSSTATFGSSSSTTTTSTGLKLVCTN